MRAVTALFFSIADFATSSSIFTDFLHAMNYAIRKELNLCNSSAIGEKMNDLVVAERQKHNGMNWSKNGSVAIASITSLKKNKEFEKWFEEKDIEFKLAA